jgi:ribosomal protein L11
MDANCVHVVPTMAPALGTMAIAKNGFCPAINWTTRKLPVANTCLQPSGVSHFPMKLTF